MELQVKHIVLSPHNLQGVLRALQLNKYTRIMSLKVEWNIQLKIHVVNVTP